MAISVNESRLRKSFEKYSRIGSTEEGGLNRVALSTADKQARDQFISDAKDLDLNVEIDELGNIFARREGATDGLDPVVIGSHLDSQPYGGRYDGQLGIICAIEIIRTLEEADRCINRPIEVVNWTNEEGTRFNLAPLGSGTFAGSFNISEALSTTDEDDTTVGEALKNIGYDGSSPCEPHSIHAYLELHIEQSTTLEQTGEDIGIVTGIVGIDWLSISIHGVSDHSGTTPLHNRQDAMVAASSVIQKIKAISSYLPDEIVATVGKMDIDPGSINVIPGEVRFTVDLRCYDDETRAEAIEHIEDELRASTTREETTYNIEHLMKTESKEFSPLVQEAVREASGRTGSDYRQMVSWATHDAMYVNKISESGMIFVPSVDGRSHSEDEYTEWSDVVTGANTYANAVLSLAKTQ